MKPIQHYFSAAENAWISVVRPHTELWWEQENNIFPQLNPDVLGKYVPASLSLYVVIVTYVRTKNTSQIQEMKEIICGRKGERETGRIKSPFMQ